jgi:hypothetical protein
VKKENLTNVFRQEDFAIEEFCKKLSRIQQSDVYIVCKPDNRGRNGEKKCDAIITRANEQLTVEHTSLMSYGANEGKKTQKEHQVLIERFIIPLKIEETIKSIFPANWITIYIPVAAFDMKFRYEQVFRKLKEELISTVATMNESRSFEESIEFKFDGIPFSVWIKKESHNSPVCFIIYNVSNKQNDIHENLKNEVIRAVQRKRDKLAQAKHYGARTLLLLDSNDTAFVNILFLARAFGNAISQVSLEGIDEVFVIHSIPTSCWIAPVKIDEKVYPNLSEFQEYVQRQIGMRD